MTVQQLIGALEEYDKDMEVEVISPDHNEVYPVDGVGTEEFNDGETLIIYAS